MDYRDEDVDVITIYIIIVRCQYFHLGLPRPRRPSPRRLHALKVREDVGRLDAEVDVRRRRRLPRGRGSALAAAAGVPADELPEESADAALGARLLLRLLLPRFDLVPLLLRVLLLGHLCSDFSDFFYSL